MGLLTRPVLKAVFPSERTLTKPTAVNSAESNPGLTLDETPSPAETEIVSPISSTPSSPTTAGRPIAHASASAADAPAKSFAALPVTLGNRIPVPAYDRKPSYQKQQQEDQPRVSEESRYSQSSKVDNLYVPAIYSSEGVHPVKMAAVGADTNRYNDDANHESMLAEKTQAMSIKGSRPPTVANGNIPEHEQGVNGNYEERPQ